MPAFLLSTPHALDAALLLAAFLGLTGVSLLEFQRTRPDAWSLPAPAPSARLSYRLMTEADVAGLCARTTAACVAEMCPNGEDFRDPEVVRGHIEGGYVVLKDGETIGTFSLNPDDASFGFWIDPARRRAGYALEAATTFLADERFRPFMQRAGCWTDNAASRRILARLGYTVEERRQTVASPFCQGPRELVYFQREDAAELPRAA